MIINGGNKSQDGVMFGSARILPKRDDLYEVLYVIGEFYSEVSVRTDSLQEAARIAERATSGRSNMREVLWHTMVRCRTDVEGAKHFMVKYHGIKVRGKPKRTGRKNCEACEERRITGGVRCSDGVVWLCKRCQPGYADSPDSMDVVVEKIGYRRYK